MSISWGVDGLGFRHFICDVCGTRFKPSLDPPRHIALERLHVCTKKVLVQGKVAAKIRSESETSMVASTQISKLDDEYRVRLYLDGIYQVGADYFTNDKTDAKVTAVHMEADAKPSNKTTDRV
jgi:hypothetical protein